MSQYPFVKAPDTFLLAHQQRPECVRIAPYESPWGTTDEKLCFVDDILIGRLIATDPSDITLVPRLDRLRDYPWPTANALLDALDLLLQETEGWRLRCEADTDQALVEDIRSRGRLRLRLRQTIAACMTGIEEIPNFAASAETCRD